MDDDKGIAKKPNTMMVDDKGSAKKHDTKMADAKSSVKKVEVTMVSCRPIMPFSLIQKINECQVAAIKKIGFSGFLELKINNFPLSHVWLFLEAFSNGSYVFKASQKKEFMISNHDVYDCFLIPFGPNPLPLVHTGLQKDSNNAENKALKDKWREAYRVKRASSSIGLGTVLKELESYKEADDHFCRLFVLLCMSLFLAPTQNNGIDLKFLRTVEDATSISHFDWCSYVLDNVVKAGSDLKKAPTTFGGCISFLMITYFQRYD
ncbi:uncharacterized protein LOC141629367 [Silene latifolia]|uniref:uncharacterized protein LOC141629367 n=1 Tax=Silene latifolia TaxID=37657 RepID=UPI003D786C99